MNFQTQFWRLLLLNPLGWVYIAFCIAPLVNAIFGRQFAGWNTVFIFGSLSLGGLLLVIALAKHAIRTRRYI